MIEVLRLGKQHGYDRLRDVVAEALEAGSHDVSAIRYLLTAGQAPELPAIDIGLLQRYERPLPVLNEYDRLLSIGVTAQ
jgi:hypothetical protein